MAAQLQEIVQATAADELMLVCDVYEPALRLRALDIAAQAMAQFSHAAGTVI